MPPRAADQDFRVLLHAGSYISILLQMLCVYWLRDRQAKSVETGSTGALRWPPPKCATAEELPPPRLAVRRVFLNLQDHTSFNGLVESCGRILTLIKRLTLFLLIREITILAR